MSMNIGFKATREIQVVKTGAIETQSMYFTSVWQTPTEVTYQIKGSEDPIQAYKNWVMAQEGCVYTDSVWADDDIWHECEPIGTVTVDLRAQHMDEFELWIRHMEQQGCTIEAVVL